MVASENTFSDVVMSPAVTEATVGRKFTEIKQVALTARVAQAPPVLLKFVLLDTPVPLTVTVAVPTLVTVAYFATAEVPTVVAGKVTSVTVSVPWPAAATDEVPTSPG